MKRLLLKNYLLFAASFLLFHLPTTRAGTTAGECLDQLKANISETDNARTRALAQRYFEIPLNDVLKECQANGAPLVSHLWSREISTVSTQRCAALHEKVDRAFELLTSLPSGRRWIVEVAFSDWLPAWDRSAQIERCSQVPDMMNWNILSARIQSLWGVSEEVAQRSIPQSVKSGNFGKAITETYFSNPGRPIQLTQHKSYFFALGTNPTQIDSFTFPNNQTLIWIQDLPDPDLALLQVVAHEIAITGDGKTNLYPWLVDAGQADSAKKWEKGTRNIFFNQVMAIIRAYRMEARILGDLRQADPSKFKKNPVLDPFKDLDPNTCHEIYQRVAKARFLSVYGASAQDQVVLQALLPKDAEVTSRSGETVNACLFFSEPVATIYRPGNGGPRPRESGW